MQPPIERPELSTADVVRQLCALGVESGGVLLVHTSFRAVRPIQDGPLGLIRALREALGPDGTLVMPSASDNDDLPFDPRTSRSAADLGAVADIFWRQPGVERSAHPFAFAAIGPRAAEVVADPLPLPPHIRQSPVGRVHDLDGQVLLLGVGHDADTSLHLAELLAGAPYRVPRHCTVLRDGAPVRIEYGENDHCCLRFAQADQWLRAAGLQNEGRVGHAWARLARARDIVQLAVQQLAGEPLVFLHPTGGGCEECEAAHASLTRSATTRR